MRTVCPCGKGHSIDVRNGHRATVLARTFPHIAEYYLLCDCERLGAIQDSYVLWSTPEGVFKAPAPITLVTLGPKVFLRNKTHDR